MKKVAMAAAVAGAFSANAMAAELSTFLYQEYSIQHSDAGGVSTTSIASAGSNMLNFNYSDDLGNGLGLIGSFSMTAHGADAGSQGNNADATTGAGDTDTQTATGIANRNSFIGLTGDFGKITFGTHELLNELEVILRDGWDANYDVGGDPIPITSVSDANGTTGAAQSVTFITRRSQAIEWTSADMNGLSLNAAYVMGAASTAPADEEGTELNVMYGAGAMKLSAGIGAYTDYAGTSGDKYDFTRISFTYDAGVVSVAGSVTSNEFTDKSASTSYKQGGRHINVTMPTASGRFLVNYMSSGDRDENGVTQTNSGVSGWDVGYLHDLTANAKSFVRYASREEDSDYDASQASNSTDTIILGLRYTY
jgi:hypothetical protein